MTGNVWGGGAVVAAVVCLSMSASAANRLGDIQRSLILEANHAEVPVSLALAVAKVESGFNAGALSNKGARGVMQIMPETALGEFGVAADTLWDADTNVRLGVQYLKRLQALYGGRWDLALSHYNGGTVKGDSPSSYTRDYVAAVQAWQSYYSQRGCDRLTAKRMVTHADSMALCLQAEGGPIASAAFTVEQPAKAVEPPLPAAAPQVPVQREGVAEALKAVKGSPPLSSPTTTATTTAVIPAAMPKATAKPADPPIPAPKPTEDITRTAAELPAEQQAAVITPAPATPPAPVPLKPKSRPATRPLPTVVADGDAGDATEPAPVRQAPPAAIARRPWPPVTAVGLPALRPAPRPVYMLRPPPPRFGRPGPGFAGRPPTGPRWW
jgi:hypothetical protein